MFHRTLDRWLEQNRGLRRKPSHDRRRLHLEPLEDRRLLSLVGVLPTYPLISYDQLGPLSYDASSQALSFQLDATPLTFRQSAASLPQSITAPRNFFIGIHVDNQGNLIGGSPTDVTVTGNLNTGGNSYSGTLLTGEVTQFGYADSGTTTDTFDFRVTPTGGPLASFYAGKDIGITTTSESSTFTGSFATDFTGYTKGNLGSVPALWSSLSGYVYNDGNGDGVKQAGEPGIAGVSVAISGTDVGGNPVSANATTDSLGAYSFSQLRPGTYTITETQPAGWLDGTDTQGTPGTGTAGNDVFTNIVLAAGVNGQNNNFAELPMLPGVNLVKLTNGQHDLNLPADSPVTWTYNVSNTGNVPLSGVTVTDDQGVTPVYQSGDTNNNGLLDLGETWTYTATGIAAAGDYTNTATATGTAADATGTVHTVVTAQDTDTYFGVKPGIAVVKLTNGVHNPDVPAGSPVTWTYDVTNTGNVPLAGVTVTDNQGVTPVYQSGDDNNNGVLDVGETWVYTATGTAVATPLFQPFVNVGTVTATDATGTVATPVSASASDSYFGVQPGIAVDKLTNGTHDPSVPAGSPVTWTYDVTNTGNVPLAGVTVTDSDPNVSPFYISGDDNGNNLLDVGETWVYASLGTAVAGQYTNTATAVGADATGTVAAPASATGSDSYFGVQPGIQTLSAASTAVGSVISDTATLSGGDNPTGIITFNLYATDGTTVVDTETAPVNGDGTYSTPNGYLPTAMGTYQWVASYGGDSSNGSVSSPFGAEPVAVTPATPTINTTVSAGSIVVGGAISDAATVSGGYSPTGTVTFNLYNNANGTGPALFTDANEPLSGGVATSKSYTTTATGSDYWVATYNGNGNNISVASGVAAEPVAVAPATPTINTTVSAGSIVVGGAISDAATVSGGYSPTGTVTFNLYNNANGTGPALFTDANEPLSGGVATSKSYTTTATGSDYWVATYNGNGNNISVASGVAAEPVAVAPATPTINTTMSAGSIVVGGAISDVATVSGGYSPTGTVTFNLYNNANGTGPALFTDANEPLSGGVATSKSYTTTATGSDYWVATYNGNGNNISVASGVAAEPVAVAPATPTINTTMSAGSIVVGGAISDVATVSGGYSPTGTVTFNLYNNANGTGPALFTDANEPLSGGVATSKSYTTTATGSDYWVATYNGNGNNISVASGVAAEPVAVAPATPTINTTMSAGSIVVGGAISDVATVSGGYSPTGTVTFNLYNNANGTGPALFTDANEPLSGGVATSKSYTTTATGSDYWVATYNGNGNNISVASGVAAEPVAVAPATPTINTTMSAGSIVVGGAISDVATVSGGYSPTGTVTFNLYNNANGTGPALFTDANEPLSGGVATSKSYTTTATGSDYWVATYNGNGNNISVASGVAAEPVTVTSATTISGTKFKDLTGNGFSSDDTLQAGVSIYLYKSTTGLGTGAGYYKSATTAADGTYSFNNLASGTYYVQEAVPSGYIQTGGGPNGSAGSTYYTICVQSGQTYTGNNFDDYLMPTCGPTNVSYLVNGCTTMSDMGGQTAQGKTVTVTFTVSTTEQLTLVSYIAPSSSWNQSIAYQQQIFDEASGTFTPGTYSLTVLIPNCYYQIDFVCGPAIDVLVPQTYNGSAYGPDNSNISYHAENRYIDSDNSGTTAFSTKSVASGDFAAAGFWSTTTGQKVINSLNGGSSATGLAKWLATTFPNLYGSGAGSHSLVNSNGSYFTNSQVVSAYAKFTSGDQQVLSAALSVYATSTNLAGTNVHSTDSHFNTSAAGSGMDTYNVGVNGAAFGLANNTTLTVMQLLVDLNAGTSAGAAVASGANTVFSGINTIGNVTNADLADVGLAYTPAQVRTAYGINNLSLDGTGQTIAIVDAYDDPVIAQAVDTFDNQFAATPSGPTLYQQYGSASSFLTVLNQNGQTNSLPATDPSGPGAANWELETALDVEWVHAVAPGAQIILVEANSQSLSDLMASVVAAANQPGVSVVSMSWGFAEGQTVLAQDEAHYDGDFTTPTGHQGVTFVVSTGDYGTADPEYPAFSPNVVAVGGTSLHLNADNSYNNETGWGYFSNSAGTSIGSGGGTSLYEPQPTYQLGVQSTGFRSTPDVSLVADPGTGAWIADPYNLPADNAFEVVGGTSLSSPCWAGMFALVNQGRSAAGQPTLNSTTPTDAQQALYSLPQADFNSITSGSNGGYTAQAGYNMVTGLGTPVADRLVPDLAAYQQSGDSNTTTPISVTGVASYNATASGAANVLAVTNVFNALIVTADAPVNAHRNDVMPIEQSEASYDQQALMAAPTSSGVAAESVALAMGRSVAASSATDVAPAQTADVSLAAPVVDPRGCDQYFSQLGESAKDNAASPQQDPATWPLVFHHANKHADKQAVPSAADSALEIALSAWHTGLADTL